MSRLKEKWQKHNFYMNCIASQYENLSYFVICAIGL